MPQIRRRGGEDPRITGLVLWVAAAALPNDSIPLSKPARVRSMLRVACALA